MPTLVMMHGMTGTAAMMRPFAEKVLPDGWNLLVPEAEFSHPNRGFTWWRYEGSIAGIDRKDIAVIAICVSCCVDSNDKKKE